MLPDYLELFKVHLCVYISLSAVFGNVMAKNYFSSNAFVTGSFVFLLACGSAAWNNIQDRTYDRSFHRTRCRVLPQGRISINHAGVFSFFLISGGLSGLLIYCGIIPFVVGIFAVIFYNGMYTPLKKKSLLAIIPGSISGMLPPLIGWTAAGKELVANEILLIMSIFVLWQIPHFFIILLKHQKRQSKIKPDNVFPCFTKIFSNNEIKLQALIWVSLYGLAIFSFLLSGLISNRILSVLTGVNAVVVLSVFAVVMIQNKKHTIIFAFAAINLSILFFMAAGILDKC